MIKIPVINTLKIEELKKELDELKFRMSNNIRGKSLYYGMQYITSKNIYESVLVTFIIIGEVI